MLLILSLILSGVVEVLAQDRIAGSDCAEAEARGSGTHRFRREGESFDIVLNDSDCPADALELRWTNGRNNGSNFNVTFLDDNRRPIYTRQLPGFLTGSYEFPLATSSSFDSRPWLGTNTLISVPSIVTIQAVPPFAYPANISYRVLRTVRSPRRVESKIQKEETPATRKAAEVRKEEGAVRAEGKER